MICMCVHVLIMCVCACTQAQEELRALERQLATCEKSAKELRADKKTQAIYSSDHNYTLLCAYIYSNRIHTCIRI
jgi:hypothetical protein